MLLHYKSGFVRAKRDLVNRTLCAIIVVVGVKLFTSREYGRAVSLKKPSRSSFAARRTVEFNGASALNRLNRHVFFFFFLKRFWATKP